MCASSSSAGGSCHFRSIATARHLSPTDDESGSGRSSSQRVTPKSSRSTPRRSPPSVSHANGDSPGVRELKKFSDAKKEQALEKKRAKELKKKIKARREEENSQKVALFQLVRSFSPSVQTARGKFFASYLKENRPSGKEVAIADLAFEQIDLVKRATQGQRDLITVSIGSKTMIRLLEGRIGSVRHPSESYSKLHLFLVQAYFG